MSQIEMKAARTDNGYCCTCDLLPGWIVAYSGAMDGFKSYVKESIDFYIEGCKEDSESYPSIFDGEYEIIYNFDIATLLDYYRGIFSFSALQEITGINQRQLAHYASGVSRPRPAQVEKIKSGLRALSKDIETVTA